MKKRIGQWLIRIGLRWSPTEFYSRPPRDAFGTLFGRDDVRRCQCGHLAPDHIVDPDGKGTLCICCFATMRHRFETVDILEAAELFYED